MRLVKASVVLGLILGAWFMVVGQHPSSAASFISTGDGGWEWVKPARGVQNWGGVFFLDDKTGWVAGMDCVILKTSDGGKSWAPQGPRIRKILNDICFTDRDHGWAVGSGMASIDPTGIILKTSDGGATWRVVLDGKTDGLRSVCFVNNSVGWAVGGYPKSVILNTTDGGETWFEQDCGVRLQEKDYRSFEGVSFVDERTGYVLASTNGRVDVYKTTDGGKTWTHTPSQTKSPRSIQFLDANTGWILTQAVILRTTDGGRTWSEVSLDKLIPPDEKYPARRNLQSFHFSDAQNGVAASVGGHVLRAGDGGNTWVLASSVPGETVSYPCVHMADEKNAWAVGYNGQMMRTSDGGSTWQSLSWGRDDYTHHIVLVSQEVGWAAGSVENSQGPGGVLLKTEDGGMTWSRRLVKEVDKLGTVFFLDEKLGWVTASGGKVLNTTDGGVTWQAHETGVTSWLGGIHFVEPLNGWIVGGEGVIVRTSDGGRTWTRRNSGTMDDLYGVYFADERTGIVCGQSGRIMKTTDGGKTWKRKGSGTVDLLVGIRFLDERTGWVSGTRGVILKTTDGGETWTARNSGKEEQLTGISFINENEGWAAGLGTTIVHTTDGGNTWTAQDYGTWNGVWDISFTDQNNGLAVGGPIILRTTTGGLPGAVWAKKQADGTDASFGHLVVTRKSDGFLLAEHPDSRAGIRIKTSDTKPSVGDYIYIHGKIVTEGSEKIIAADSIDITCAGWGTLPAKEQ